MDYQVHTLSNGIRVLHIPTSSNISHACFLINAGSRDEKPEKSGLAHFIEHLLFKRTKKRTTSQILNRLELVGGDLNAYTTKEYTCIHASFLRPYLERTLDLFEDLVFHSTFPENEMIKEAEVILDEIASYQDQPEEAIQDDFEDMLFEGHALGRNILGSPESIRTFTKPDVFHFIQSNYQAHEMILGIYGCYNFKKIIRLVDKFFRKITDNTSTNYRIKPNITNPQKKQLEKPINQAHCMLGCHSYSIHSPHKLPFLLLNNFLGGVGMSSRLNLEIREKYGIAYSIESNYTPLSDTGIFSIYFGTDVEKIEKALKLIHRELKKIREYSLSKTQLHQAKQKFIGQIALAEENRMSLLISLSKNLLDYNRIETLEEIFTKIDSIHASQLLEIANEMFDPSKLNMVVFEPLR